MRHFQNSVLDFKCDITGEYVSAPLETAWASEAIFFVRLENVRGRGFRLAARAQFSVNGIDWIDEGTALGPITGEGQYAIRLKHFGGWLRLVGRLEGEDAGATITTNLVLKE
jgi:hypothetical protein